MPSQVRPLVKSRLPGPSLKRERCKFWDRCSIDAPSAFHRRSIDVPSAFLLTYKQAKQIKLSQISWQRMRERLSQRYAQGASDSQRLTYLKRWLQWAKRGVSLDEEKLLLTTSSILPNNQLTLRLINSCKIRGPCKA